MTSIVFRSLARMRRLHLFIILLFLFCWFGPFSLIFNNSYSDDDTFDTFGLRPPQDPYYSQPDASQKSPQSSGKKNKGLYGSSASVKDLLGYYMPGKSQTNHHEILSAKRADYSIKPIVYVFPQFHPIPENDKFWGVNFTEWTNVKKLTVSKEGTETQRPAKEVGFYNLLDLSTRKRWTETMKKSRIHGIVYHHYWFGYPVMDGVLKAMLKDGHPDIPFMLNWANEPWTVRWDGMDIPSGDGVILAQNYGGPEDWRKHYDWMVPFFKHPNYIRVNGKVQMMIYNPSHMGDTGKRMFEAWRIWASEDPAIGGMDVIETKIDSDNPDSRGPTDAMNEFGFRSGGGKDYSLWPSIGRSHRIYYRGAMVSWDNTPRHATDGGGDVVVFAHPRLWKGKMTPAPPPLSPQRSDPNPPGEENFFFINAFNEWGEGNTLEASVRWGDGFMRALDEAMEYADKQIPWRSHLLEQNTGLIKEVANNVSQVDVCVIIRDYKPTYPWGEPWTLSQTLESLRNMQNKRWRGVVANVLPAGNTRFVDVTLLDAQDARVVSAAVPEDVLKKSGEAPNAAEVTDWVIKNIDTISPSCGRAKYMLITNATNRYEPDTFDAAEKSESDIIGLNFESRESMDFADAALAENYTWDQRCERFKDGTTQNRRAATADAELLDLGAVLINMRRWRDENVHLAQTGNTHGEASVLRELNKSTRSPWKWASPAVDPSVSCHLLHADSMTTCLRTGRLWADLPKVEPFKSGCYSGFQLQYAYGGHKVTELYDYSRFHKDPYCVRLSQDMYEGVTSGKIDLKGS
ncbi:Putative glycosyltransferase WbsX [Colletotrichum destructivum]|uniref:Glycosyltransferase WbsX n=1 Tax=Colletotrichum destructivum TaxID=34406 RepID=A0AAX4II34_9PEZI|nr:Putative glycosyltransferase WbsX [Colletotrichum destructivum]